MMVSVLGIDLGRNTCSLAGLDASGGVVLRRRVRRDTVLAATAKLAPCVVQKPRRAPFQADRHRIRAGVDGREGDAKVTRIKDQPSARTPE